jgi:hypothetical protein
VQGINDLVTPFLAVFLGEHFAAGGPALAGGMDAWDVATLSDAARPARRALPWSSATLRIICSCARKRRKACMHSRPRTRMRPC